MKKLITPLVFVFIISFTYGQNKIEKVGKDTYKTIETGEYGKHITKKSDDGDLIRRR